MFYLYSGTTLAAAPAASTTTNPNTTPATAPPLPIVAIGAGGGIAAIVIVGIIIVVIVIIVVVVKMKNRKKGEATFGEDYAEVTKAPQPPPIPDYFYNKGYAEITTTANGHIELVQPHHSHQASDSTDYPMPAKLKAKPEYLQPNPMYASADHLNNWEPGGMRSMKPAGSMPLLDSSASPFNSQFNIYAEPSKVPPPVPSYHGSLDGESLFNEDINPDVFQEPNNDQLSAAEVNPVHALYANPQPIARSDLLLEVKEKNIREIKELGMGQFGLVVLAHTVGLSLKQLKLSESNTDPGVSIVVAVKRLKPDADATTREAFEKEIKFMARLNHENVVRLVGVCLSHNAFIMMQYMENGDLNQFLRSKSLSLTKMPLSEDSNFVIIPHLIYVSLQVAAGMRYLASLHFIHRDLATRNCLVGQDFTVKIADFGMSRDLYDSYYYTIRGKAMLPIRWMANECFYGQFSEKTDVWAFGVTMWEIFTLCKKQPYEEFSDQDVINDAIQASERKLLSQPRDCPSEVYHVMLRCWVNEPKERANFDELHQLLSQIHAYSDLS